MAATETNNYLKRRLPRDDEVKGWQPDSLRMLEHIKSSQEGRYFDTCSRMERPEEPRTVICDPASTTYNFQPDYSPTNSKAIVNNETEGWHPASLAALAYVKTRDPDLRPPKLPGLVSQAYVTTTPTSLPTPSSTRSSLLVSAHKSPINKRLHTRAEAGSKRLSDRMPLDSYTGDVRPLAMKKRKLASSWNSSLTDFQTPTTASARVCMSRIAQPASRFPSNQLEYLPEEILYKIFDLTEDMALPRASPRLRKRLEHNPFYLSCVLLFGDQLYTDHTCAGDARFYLRQKHAALNDLPLLSHEDRLRRILEIAQQDWFAASHFLRVQRYFIRETIQSKWPGGVSPLQGTNARSIRSLEDWLERANETSSLDTDEIRFRWPAFDIAVEVNPTIITITRTLGSSTAAMVSTFPANHSRELHGPRPRLPNALYRSNLSMEKLRLLELCLIAVGALKVESRDPDLSKWTFERVSQSLLETSIEENRLKYFKSQVNNGKDVLIQMGIDIEALFVRVAVVGLQAIANVREVDPYKEVDAEAFFKVLFQVAPNILVGKDDDDGFDSVYPVVVSHSWAKRKVNPSGFVKCMVDRLRRSNPRVTEIQPDNEATLRNQKTKPIESSGQKGEWQQKESFPAGPNRKKQSKATKRRQHWTDKYWR